MWALAQEIWSIYLHQRVDLKDLLLMFIFAEVLGMIEVFYTSQKFPIMFPIFIGITAISRAIILEGKDDLSGVNLQQQAIAILILSKLA